MLFITKWFIWLKTVTKNKSYSKSADKAGDDLVNKLACSP